MKKIDFLFIRDEHANINLEFFDDIELSCLRSILSTVEFDLFTNVLKKPLVEQDKIYERQNIFKDLMAYPQVASHLISICDEAQKNKISRHDLVYSRSPLKQKLLEYLKVINKNLDVPDELLSALSNREFHSESLSNLSKQLEIKDDINKIKEILNTLARNILDDNISLQIKFGNTFKLKSASVYSIGAKQSSPPKRGIFNRKQNIGGTPYGYDFIANLQMGQMLESGVKNISHIIYQLNSHILQFCNNLSM